MIMKDDTIKSHRRPWVLVVAVVIGLFMTSMNLSEWYRIGIEKKTAGYPFGGEGPVPYFYKTPELYSRVNGVFAVVYLCLTLLVCWSLLANKRRIGFFAFSGIIATVIIMYLNSLMRP